LEDGKWVRRDASNFVYGAPPSYARLYLGEGKTLARWTPTVEGGSLRFRQVRKGLPWTLYIPWGKDVGGTAFLSGDSLTPGPMEIEVEPGAKITGKLLETREGCSWVFIGTRSGPPISGVTARRGPARVEGWLDDDGTFEFPPTPKGTWEISAWYVCYVRAEKKSHYMVATKRVEAGDSIELSPQPVPREEWVKARRY
jgi:hypothetical protein